MKVHKLLLHNIGPFLGTHEIDFSKLDDIFLICGKTGSGKTTIFDSIMYVLYGQTAGARSAITRMMRSHFVAANEEASVTLEFTLKSVLYKVMRILPWEYEKRSGEKGKKPEEVQLYRFDAQWQLMYNKTREADEALISLIGLSADEFSRIVLLPQGAFADFLHQNSNERKKSLSQLFPISLYQRISERAKTYEKHYMQQITDIERDIQMIKRDFDCDTFDEHFENLSSQLAKSEAQLGDIQSNLLHTQKRLESSQSLYTTLQHKITWQAELQEKLSQKTIIKALQTKVEKSRNASLCIPLLHSKKQYADRIQKTQEDSILSAHKTDKVQQELQNLEASMNEITTRESELKEFHIKAHTFETALDIETRILSIEKEITEKRQKVHALEKEQNSNTVEYEHIITLIHQADEHIAQLEQRNEDDVRASEQLEVAKTNKEKAEQKTSFELSIADAHRAYDDVTAICVVYQAKYDEAKKNVQQLHNDKNESEKRFHASALASKLQHNMSCPVCGSLDHPSPAPPELSTYDAEKTQEQITVQEFVVSRTEKELQEKILKQNSCLTRLTQLSEDYKQYETDIPDVATAKIRLAEAAAHKQKTKQAIDEAHKALSRKQNHEHEKQRLETSRAHLQKQSTALDADIAAQRAQKKELQERIPNSNGLPLRQALEELRSCIREHEVCINTWRAQKQQLSETLAQERGKISELEKSLKSYEEHYHRISIETEHKIHTCGFLNEGEVESAFMDSTQQQQAEQEILQWKERCTELSALILQAEHELGDKEIEDCAKLKIHQSQLREMQHSETQHYSQLTSERDVLNEKKNRWKQLHATHRELEQEAKPYIELSNDLNGNNPKRRSFDSWMLGVYLEEITAHANKRLERISDGRYTLLLNTDEKMGNEQYLGLNLEIFDAYTGKTRPCQTLSGGETFMASISLALGLSDTVQNRSGGIQLDSLFIDEGFGTLDEVSLEKALSILDEIRGTRMVALISHVAELKNRITSRIDIHKTVAGSSIEIYTE